MSWAETYRIDVDLVDACGLELDADDCETIVSGVQALLADDSGHAQAMEALADLPETDFEQGRLDEILNSSVIAEPEWKVGEALAEHVLVEDLACEFPWPHSRSQRNPHSIGGGVDLIGFQYISGAPRFAFGEIKTSCQEAAPPSVLTGRHGLAGQLFGLASSDSRARWGVNYLAMQALNRPWLGTYRAAMKRYLRDPRDVSMFGAMVRSTTPDRRDLDRIARDSEALVDAPLSFVLRALYVGPEGLKRLAGREIELETVA